MLIAFLENNLSFDGEKYTISIPEALRPYMGGKEVITY
jgi:seryl-tRNA synthetase